MRIKGQLDLVKALTRPQVRHYGHRTALQRPNFEKDKVYLVQFPISPHIRSISPFSLKLETWLRVNSVNYDNVYSVRSSKKGQIPYIELNGVQIPDSNIIIQDLTQKFNLSLDQGLSAQDKAISHAVTLMVESNLAQIGFYWRYGHHNEEFTEKMMENFMDRKVSMFFFRKVQPAGIRFKNFFNGIARHSFQEIEQFSFQDLQAISALLGDKKFLLTGDHPTTVDCTLFGHLAQFLYIPMAFPQKKYIHEHCPNIVEHVDRMKALVWPDWDEACNAKCMEGKMGLDYKTDK